MNSLPEIFQPRTMTNPAEMQIDTTVIEPLVCTQTTCRFVLEKKGVLNTDSVIQLALKVTEFEDGDSVAFLPIKTGIFSAIKSCTLYIGSKIIAISDDLAYQHTMKRQFNTCERKSQIDMVKIGTTDVICPSSSNNGLYMLRDGSYTDPDNINEGVTLPQFQLTSSDVETPIWTIKLSELFPMMLGFQLPLYLINEPCSIEIQWNQQPNGVQGVLGCFNDGYAGNSEITINTRHVKFLCDYLQFNEISMNEAAERVMSDQGQVVPYKDTVLTSTIFPNNNLGGNNKVSRDIIRDIGVSGFHLCSVLCHMHRDTYVNPLLGVYSSEAYHIPETVQIRVNDLQEYPREVHSEAEKANLLSQVFNKDISIHNAEYSFDMLANKQNATNDLNNAIFDATVTLNGIQSDEITGSQHYIGANFTKTGLNMPNDGVQIGIKPVQFLHTITTTVNDNHRRNVRYFSEVERTMILKNGIVEVSK